MPIITWSEELQLGVSVIDSQHQRLVGLLNNLFDAMTSGKGKSVLDETLEGLIAYTKTHFTDEERLMSDYDYPGIKKHLIEHDRLTREVLEFQRAYQGGAVLSINIVNFLRSWLEEHILNTDRELAEYIKEKGVN